MYKRQANISMYCDAKEIRFRNREELTLKSKAKTFIIDILLDIVGGCFIAIGDVYKRQNFLYIQLNYHFHRIL